MLRSHTLSEKLNLSAAEEQRLLRRAEARVASAARSVRKLADVGEALIDRLDADSDPSAQKLRQDYSVLLERLDHLAEAIIATHDSAEALCRSRGAVVHESGGIPKLSYPAWLTGRHSSDIGKAGLTAA
ncbi:MAG: hypothetical protein AAGL49_09430 [Pseudomonadota bacterium]